MLNPGDIHVNKQRLLFILYNSLYTRYCILNKCKSFLTYWSFSSFFIFIYVSCIDSIFFDTCFSLKMAKNCQCWLFEMHYLYFQWSWGVHSGSRLLSIIDIAYNVMLKAVEKQTNIVHTTIIILLTSICILYNLLF